MATHRHSATPKDRQYTALGLSLGSSLIPKPPPRKKLHGLPCLSAENYTNQEYRAFFEIHSSDALTCRTLLGYFSDVAVSFF